MSRGIRVAGLAALAAVLAVVALAGCGEDDAGAGTTTAPPSLEGRWALTDLMLDGAMTAVPSGVAVDATFTEGRVAGSAGVNSYSGAYTVGAAGELAIGPLAATQMAGPPKAMAVEAAYLKALDEAAAFSSDGRTLTLSSAAGEPLLEFAADAPSLVGSWEVTGYNNGAEAVVSPIVGSTITAVFGDDGTVSGDAGVNTYRSDFTTSGDPAAPQIAISPPASTQKAGPQELMDQEQAYLAALASAATFTVRGDTAELRDGSDAIAVTLTRR